MRTITKKTEKVKNIGISFDGKTCWVGVGVHKGESYIILYCGAEQLIIWILEGIAKVGMLASKIGFASAKCIIG